MWAFILFSFASAQDCEVCCSTLSPRSASMTYTYYQDSGRFVGGEGDSRINTIGYSGNNTEGYIGKNHPEYECIRKVGPAPVNTYILEECSDSMKKYPVRPCTFPMTPMNDRPECPRPGLSVHGCECCSDPQCDYSEPPCGFCSGGCIVIAREHREKLRKGDTINVLRNDPDYNVVYEF